MIRSESESHLHLEFETGMGQLFVIATFGSVATLGMRFPWPSSAFWTQFDLIEVHSLGISIFSMEMEMEMETHQMKHQMKNRM